MKVSGEHLRWKAERDALAFLVDVFSDEMEAQLIKKLQQGYSGWDNPDEDYNYEARMRAALDEGRWIDLANLAMLKWNKEN